MSFTVSGTIMQTPIRGELEVQRDVEISVDDSGKIVSITPRSSTPASEPRPGHIELSATTVMIPGLIDTHVHAPQWPQLGTGLDLPLETWLFEHTFPLEQRLTDPVFAAMVWPSMVSTLLAHGTTTAVYYATIDVETTTMLAATCAELGQRAFVGRVAMDHPEGTPDWYRDADAQAGVRASAASIDAINALGSALVRPIITPRFTPACTDELMLGPPTVLSLSVAIRFESPPDVTEVE